MRIIPANASGIAEALIILKQGGCVVHATETCYGIACDLTNAEAVAHLFAIKDRPIHMPVSALFPSVDEVKRYVEWNTEAERLAKEHLPGPLTLILMMREDAPHRLHPVLLQARPTLGIRISSHPLAHSLITAFDSPISTTSANLHGRPNPYSAEDILAQFGGRSIRPDLVLDGGRLPKNPPSTVIDLTKGGEVRRKGVIGG